MNVVVKDAEEFQKRFCTSVEQARRTAADLAELFQRLSALGENCVGMKVSVGSKPFVVVREGGTFLLVEESTGC
jgi:hypothetical protein